MGDTSPAPPVTPFGIPPSILALSGPEANVVRQPGVLVFAMEANSCAAFLAEGKIDTLSFTINVAPRFWNCGLVTDGGFSAMSELATPMQRASCAAPGVVLVFGALVFVQPDGMWERTSNALRAWACCFVGALPLAPAPPGGKASQSK